MNAHRLTASTLALATAAAAVILLTPGRVDAHCQVPCGIYDDTARIIDMHEDTTTIAKAQAQMAKLAGKSDAQSQQQFARWVATKESHATAIITVISEYFLTQKLKPVPAPGDDATDDQRAAHAAYLAALADHHAVMVAAMKTKQSADPATATALKAAITRLHTHWGAPHQH